MTKTAAYFILAATCWSASSLRASPGTTAMLVSPDGDGASAASAKLSSPSTAAPVTFSDLTPSPAFITDVVDRSAFDAEQASPDQPHPMVPLPPSAWAGFLGLLYIARRVLRQSSAARA